MRSYLCGHFLLEKLITIKIRKKSNLQHRNMTFSSFIQNNILKITANSNTQNKKAKQSPYSLNKNKIFQIRLFSKALII